MNSWVFISSGISYFLLSYFHQGCYISSDPGNFRKFPRKFPPGRNTILPPKLEEMEEIQNLAEKNPAFFSCKNCWTTVAKTINAYAFHKCIYFKCVMNNIFIYHIILLLYRNGIFYIFNIYLTQLILSVYKHIVWNRIYFDNTCNNCLTFSFECSAQSTQYLKI